jgi:hypothetical protein
MTEAIWAVGLQKKADKLHGQGEGNLSRKMKSLQAQGTARGKAQKLEKTC